MEAYNFLKFLEATKGKKIPLIYRLEYDPDSLTKEDLNVESSLYLIHSKVKSLPEGLKVKQHLILIGSKIKSLPDNLVVGGNLDLNFTKLSSLPKNLKVGGDLDIRNTPFAKKHTEQQIARIYIDNDIDVGGRFSI